MKAINALHGASSGPPLTHTEITLPHNQQCGAASLKEHFDTVLQNTRYTSVELHNTVFVCSQPCNAVTSHTTHKKCAEEGFVLCFMQRGLCAPGRWGTGSPHQPPPWGPSWLTPATRSPCPPPRPVVLLDGSLAPNPRSFPPPLPARVQLALPPPRLGCEASALLSPSMASRDSTHQRCEPRQRHEGALCCALPQPLLTLFLPHRPPAAGLPLRAWRGTLLNQHQVWPCLGGPNQLVATRWKRCACGICGGKGPLDGSRAVERKNGLQGPQLVQQRRVQEGACAAREQPTLWGTLVS